MENIPSSTRLISCLMPTYNKMPQSQALVEEAIHSFLLQTYELCELIVCNDCPQQTLTFDHPRVKILNEKRRFRSLGEKLNAMIEQSSGDWLARWDDDDISLPWRLQWSVAVQERTKADYVASNAFWATNAEITEFAYGAYGQCMFRKHAWRTVNGFRHTSFGEDAAFEQALGGQGFNIVREDVDYDSCYYFYRWNTGSEHVSGFGRNGKGWERIGAMPVVPGVFKLHPHWEEDYVARARAAAKLYRESAGT